MRIAQLNSAMYPTKADSNNAIYSHVGTLADGLVRMGHEVTLYGAGNSNTQAFLRSVHEQDLHSLDMTTRIQQHYTNLLIAKCYEQASDFDIIHSHFTLLSSYHAKTVSTPTLVSIHSPIDADIMPFLHEYRNLKYVSFSLAQRKIMPDLNWYANVYHGVDTSRFAYNETPEEYLLYLGRVTNEKGVHFAIEAAKSAGVPLLIAGRSYPAEGYWHAEIEKHIDGVAVRYVGEQGLEEKIKLLQNARALVFPTQYQEVFGYVMIEALSCGTPVIAWNNGSVPEIVKHEKTGFVVNSVEEMTEAIHRVHEISRLECRRRAEQFFSMETMIAGYAKIYERILRENDFQKQKVAEQRSQEDPR